MEGKFYKGLTIATPISILLWALIIWGLLSLSAQAGQEKVYVCHFANMKTLQIAAPALGAHLAHGDTQGSCADVPNQPEKPERPPIKVSKVPIPFWVLWGAGLGIIVLAARKKEKTA